MRFSADGFLLLAFLMLLVGPLLLLVPPVLATLYLRHRSLPAGLTVPFVALVPFLLVAALFTTDNRGYGRVAGILEISGRGGEPVPDWFRLLGNAAAIAYLVCLVWLVVAAVRARRV
ncbi:hypothetical protein PSA01_27150 [Pseudonocardia saturnea]|uniref:Uncharacterized protein n=1 Tax=Pseudonocardia saturnea TaxID=33909 RepID=A0ABQ0RYF0_9PSEU|nr:hypothetical protein Pdca_58210 [Pseudonocardia autotrophica]GEC25686.1 hypothetical protein PSA01_27150 [Pseudonocardia saturnea]